MNKNDAAQIAKGILQADPVFLDTETTGIGNTAEVIDLAIVNLRGGILYDHLIKPMFSIPAQATAIHHISNEMVNDAMRLGSEWPTIKKVLSGRLVITYSADFDYRMIMQSAILAGVKDASLPVMGFFCAMQLYSHFRGELGNYGTYRWHKLEAAAQQCKLEYDATLHRALADAELARRVFLAMSEYQEVSIQFGAPRS